MGQLFLPLTFLMLEKFKRILKFIIIYKKIISYTLSFILIVLILLFSDYGLFKKIELSSEKRKILKEIEIQKKLKDSLNFRIEIISTNKSEIEKIARKYYGLVKPQESVYFIVNETNK